MEEIRLNKYISETGFCSRREADELIATERVTVNGILAKVGMKVSLADKVRVDGEILKWIPELAPVKSVQNRRKIGKESSLRRNTKPKGVQTRSELKEKAAGRRNRQPPLRKEVSQKNDPETFPKAAADAETGKRSGKEPVKVKSNPGSKKPAYPKPPKKRS